MLIAIGRAPLQTREVFIKEPGWGSGSSFSFSFASFLLHSSSSLLQHRFFLATFQPAFSVQTIFKMKSFAYATVAFALATSVTARTFKVVNKCSYTIWPAVRPTLPLSLIRDTDAFASHSCSLT